MHIDLAVSREEIVALLDGSNAHMTFDEVMADFPLDRINARPAGIPYAPWHFLEHLRIAQWDILEFVRNPAHVSPAFPQEYRPPVDATATRRQWAASIQRFRNDLDDLKAMATDPNLDLLAPLPHAPDYTIYRELLLAADHNAYHIGEFALLRQILNAWPPQRPYLTGSPD